MARAPLSFVSQYESRLAEEGLTSDPDQLRSLFEQFRRLADTEPEGPGDLLTNGRPMRYRYAAEDMAWFDFEALCGPPRSKNDYIELARCRQTVFMSDIPVMGGSRDDRTRPAFVHR